MLSKLVNGFSYDEANYCRLEFWLRQHALLRGLAALTTVMRRRQWRRFTFPAQSANDLVRDVKTGAVVIDCSTEGNLEVAERAAYLSTHYNHLGQITTALALYNTALCALWQRGMKG